MEFNLKPIKITKSLLKEHRSEEEYMTFYLGIIPDKDLHKNPLRADTKPTASFYRSNSKELIFKDWKTGYHANFIDVVMEKYNVTYPLAINIIAQDFGLLEKTNTKLNKAAKVYDGSVVTHKGGTALQCEVQNFTKVQLKWWNSFGISEKTLSIFNVFSVKSLFINSVYKGSSSSVNPIYGYYFGKDQGRELWKIYFPKKKTHRFLLNNQKLQGVKQLIPIGDIVVVTKSLKDVMSFYEMGIPAVAPQAESVIISQAQYNALAKRFKYIIFNGDWDRAGQLFMINSRKKYKGIALTFTNKKTHGKDISDFIKNVGFDEAKLYVYKVMNSVLTGDYNYKFKYCTAS